MTDADADAGDEGPPRDRYSSSGDQETASADEDADGREPKAAGDDALLPDGPALFGERPIDR